MPSTHSCWVPTQCRTCSTPCPASAMPSDAPWPRPWWRGGETMPRIGGPGTGVAAGHGTWCANKRRRCAPSAVTHRSRRGRERSDMNRPFRILAVTVGLIVAGAVFGAIAGGVAFGIATLITEGPAAAADPSVLLIGGFFGGPIGAVTGPAVAWLLLRHVSLGRLFSGAVLGTVVGGVAGWLL